MVKISELIIAVTNAYGAPATKSLSSAISKCVTEGNINDFHPDHRPATLSEVKRVSHFKGFPFYSSSNITWSWVLPRSVAETNIILFLIRGFHGGETWGYFSFDAISHPETIRVWQEYPTNPNLPDENMNLYYSHGYKNTLFLAGYNLKTTLSVFHRNSDGSKGSPIVGFEDVVIPGGESDTSDAPFGSVGVNFSTNLIGTYGIYIETLVEDVIANVKVDYFYSEDLAFPKTNAVSCIIEGFDYEEASTPNIDIGVDGTTITVSYDVSFDDETELLSGEEMGLTLTIKRENSGGFDIFSGMDSRPTHGSISVTKTVTSGEIGTVSKIWISAELGIVSP